MGRAVVRWCFASTLVVILAAGQACVRGGFNPSVEDGGEPDGPLIVSDSVLPADAATADFAAQALSHGGNADPFWSGASIETGATLDKPLVRLDTLPTFRVKKAKLSSARAWATATGYRDGIIVFGGSTMTNESGRSTKIEVYNAEQDAFTSVGPLPKGVSMSAVVRGYDIGKFYLIKGLDPTHYFEGRIHSFDVFSKKLVDLTVTNLLTSNRHAAVRIGDLIYIFGGFGTGPIRHEIQTFNIKTNTVSTLASTMNSVGGGRTRLQAYNYGTKIYLFGGTTQKSTTTPAAGTAMVSDILAYTIASGTLAKVASLPVPLMNMAVGGRPDGKICIVGGDTPTTPPACKRSDAVYLFDPATNKVSTSATLKLPYPLSGAAFAGHYKTGKLYLIGGRDDSTSGLSDDVIEMFPFYPQGVVRGPVVDTGGAGSVWTALYCDSEIPQDTKITLAVRASESPMLRDDAKPDWQTVGPSPISASQLPKGRYLQWRATLSSTNSAVTPTLRSVNLRYQRVE